jgi:hypothetical protein
MKIAQIQNPCSVCTVLIPIQRKRLVSTSKLFMCWLLSADKFQITFHSCVYIHTHTHTACGNIAKQLSASSSLGYSHEQCWKRNGVNRMLNPSQTFPLVTSAKIRPLHTTECDPLALRRWTRRTHCYRIKRVHCFPSLVQCKNKLCIRQPTS